MKVIHKYQLNEHGQTTTLSLKQGFRIVHAEYILVEKAVFVWVEEPLAAKIPTHEIEIMMVKSGEPLAKEFEHVFTAVDSFAPEAYHIFQKLPEQALVYPLEVKKADFSLVENA